MTWLERVFGGPKEMAALPAGTEAPDFSLPAVSSGKSEAGEFSLRAALQKGPVLVAFFKVGCPTCQYTFPFLERIHKSYGDSKITMVGISQNEEEKTTGFLKEFGVTFRVLLDNPVGYEVSNAYGLTNVPSLFLVGQDGKIEISSVGWLKPEIEMINRKLAAAQATPAAPIFKPGEEVREFKAG